MSQAAIAQRMQRSWRFPTPLVTDYGGFLTAAWAGVLVVTFAGSLVSATFFGLIPASAWELITPPARVYMAVISAFVVYSFLPLYVSHGQTRRGFAIEGLIALVVHAALATVLITLGFVIEAGWYRVMGWTRGVPNGHLFTSYGNLPLIVAEYGLAFLVWSAAGAFAGAAFYRSSRGGWLALPPALVMVGITGSALGESLGPITRFYRDLTGAEAGSLPFATVVSVACILVAGAATWLLIRDVPIRKR